MSVSSGQVFPPGGILAALAGRTTSTYVINSEILLSARVSGDAFGVLSYTPSTSGWSIGVTGAVSSLEPIGVVFGYTLDQQKGLWSWGASGFSSFGSPPYVALLNTNGSDYVLTQDALFTAGGIAITLSTTPSKLLAASASGASIFSYSPSAAWKITTGGAVTSGALNFSPTCILASGSSSIIGGSQDYSLSSGATALALNPSADTFVAFNPAGTAATFTLSGTPESWQLLASSTGLPTTSSSIGAAWSSVGNLLALADGASGRWYIFNYTGGTLSLNSSGAASGITKDIAFSPDGTYAAIPNPSVSGVTILLENGATWINEGNFFSGAFPSVATVSPISGSTFAIGSSGQATLIQYVSSNWTSGQAQSIPLVPSVASYNPTTHCVFFAADSGAFACADWGQINTVESGTWSSASGTPIGIVNTNSAEIVFTASDYHITSSTGTPSPVGSGALGFTANVVGGLTSQSTTIVAGASNTKFFEQQSPSAIEYQQEGIWTTFSGTATGAANSLGVSMIPSAIGLADSGSVIFGFTNGYIQPVSGAITKLFPAGGPSSFLAASGLTWISSTVPGGLAWVSGV